MSASRIPEGGEIDRRQSLTFEFDGQKIHGFVGDTIASALLANNVRVVGRSFKYHRPRGIWGAGVDEPNAIVDVKGGLNPAPNVRATTEPANAGLTVRSVNSVPSASRDRKAFLDRLARFIPAAFYYKTFMRPDWHTFEPYIRKMAGLGQLDPTWSSDETADQINRVCDVLIVGAGPAGLLAALKASEAGRSVIVCDEKTRIGGSLLHRHGDIDGLPSTEWIAIVIAKLIEYGATILTETTAFGVYDHNLVALSQRRGDGRADVLWRVRARNVVLATGAIERPLPFANNDLPGIMSSDAALQYLRRFAVLVGRRIVVATTNSSVYEAASALAQAGAHVTVVDYRRSASHASTPTGANPRVIQGRSVIRAHGRVGVTGVLLDDGQTIAADCVIVSGGWTPTIHLFCQAKGRLVWDEELLAFIPGGSAPGITVAGAANGKQSLQGVIADGANAAFSCGIPSSRIPNVQKEAPTSRAIAAWPTPLSKGRVWIDYQNDVTAKDVELAARENFISVEHLKRYTTLGMANDQGKTSNLNGLALLGQITKRTIPEVGTTTYRPPYTPISLATLAGSRTGILMNPVRRLPLEPQHRADGAVLQEYGGWLRPAFYGKGNPDKEIQREAYQARKSVALFDGSALGKIEVIGPQAAEFLDFIYYNTMSTLKPGRCRYGFILSESGVVYDDGVLVRLGDDHFVVSCSSSHVAGVHALLEEWRQDRFDRNRLVIHDSTADAATITVSGLKSRELLNATGLGVELDDSQLPHMATTTGMFEGIPVRITRVSFTGDRSYEVSIQADRAPALWERISDVGHAFNAVKIGIEALMILRAEKGYIIIGKDTDGLTRPQDLGMSGPIAKKAVEFIGRRSLLSDEARRHDRKQLVGLEVPDGEPPLETGAHGIVRSNGKVRSIGYVTSSYMSPILGRPIALGLIEAGVSQHGETIEVQHLGKGRRARIVAPCTFDPAGERLNG
jgi:sarcosine oxidase subunit alpha